jgi:hypothetical protein
MLAEGGMMVDHYRTYSASSSIDIPDTYEGTAMLRSKSPLAMVLAKPKPGTDGNFLNIESDGQACHTVTMVGQDLPFDVFTFPAHPCDRLRLMSLKGNWFVHMPRIPCGTTFGIGIS